MQQTITPAQAIVVGRDAELALLGRFVSGREAPVAFVLAGSPGLGKTTLWEAGLEMARQNALRVLAARPTDAEAGLSFAAIADLLEELDTATLSRVPHPQKRALDIALAHRLSAAEARPQTTSERGASWS